MKIADIELVSALRREAATDTVRAPEAFDFSVLRAIRDTAPALPTPRREPTRLYVATVAAAVVIFALVLGFAGTMGTRLESVRAAGESISDVAESAARLARSFRAPRLPEIPGLRG